MSTELECRICGYHCAAPAAGELGACRGNTERFAGDSHHLWKCPRCASIHNIDPVDFADLYRDYPLNQRRLDVFARGTLRNLLRRLERAGLAKDASILDYGCGDGEFLRHAAAALPQRRLIGFELAARDHVEAVRDNLLLVQGNPREETDVPGPQWLRVAEAGRPGDKHERFRLYRMP